MSFLRNISVLFITAFNFLFTANPYYSLNNDDVYSIIEYQILRKSNGIYVLNQPYKVSKIQKLLLDNKDYYNYFMINNYYKQNSYDKLNVYATPSILSGPYYLNDDKELAESIFDKSSIGISFSSVMKISDFLYINEVDINKGFKYDENFHGDTNEWITGYFSSSYTIYESNRGFEFFAGRMSRNFGLLNDYSTILSNNSYSFDHFGFSTTGSSLKYSFYTTRLNDTIGADISGETMDIGVEANCKRFWTIQRLDYKMNDDIQFSISESIIYGGPDQQLVASYINPINFFYASQRNQKIQLNGFWQANLFYRIKSGFVLYLDVFVDDIIVNNESENIERDFHPDRLGVLLKLSTSKFKDYLISLRYARISNETYTSLRTFENYLYYNNSIGFPYNSYESIKLSAAYLKKIPFYCKLSFELFQKGDKDLFSPFNDEITEFPLGEVSKGILSTMNISNFFEKVKVMLKYDLLYRPDNWNVFFNDNKYEHNINFSIQYYFYKLI